MIGPVELEVVRVGKLEMVVERELVVVQGVHLIFALRALAAIACSFFLLLRSIVRVVTAANRLKKLEKLVTLKVLKVKNALPRREHD